MTEVGTLGNGGLWVVLLGMLNVSIAVATYGACRRIVSQRVGIGTEKRPVEEALLNFSMEEVGWSTERTGCAVGKNEDRAQRLLDPQLPAFDKRNHWGSAISRTVRETN